MIPIVVTLPGIKLVPGDNQREHWAVKAKRAKAQRGATACELRGRIAQLGYARHEYDFDKNGKPVCVATFCGVPLVVTITRIAPRELDPGDNMNSSAKHVRDEVAALLGVNDKDDIVTYCYAQERGKVREYAVRIEIRERT